MGFEHVAVEPGDYYVCEAHTFIHSQMINKQWGTGEGFSSAWSESPTGRELNVLKTSHLTRRTGIGHSIHPVPGEDPMSGGNGAWSEWDCRALLESGTEIKDPRHSIK